MKLTGTCACGEVSFESGSLTGPIAHCHCMTCQKVHGAAYVTTARAAKAGFRWTRGDEHLASYESSPGKHRHFCGACGTHMMAEWDDRDTVILRVAALDTDPGEQPVVHIWTSHDRSWLSDDGLPRMPEGRMESRQ